MTAALKLLDEIEALSREATPGPWDIHPYSSEVGAIDLHINRGPEYDPCRIAMGDASADAAFICRARTALPLLSRVLRMVAQARCEMTYSDGGDCNAHCADSGDSCWPCCVRRAMEEAAADVR